MSEPQTDSSSQKSAGAGLSRAARRRRRRDIWVAMAAFLLLAGVVGSLLGARSVAGSDRQRSHQAFISSSAEVASTLRLAIQHEEDLVVSARAYILGNPSALQTPFLRWTVAVGAFARYPELEGGGEVIMVPASRLAAFAAHESTDPSSPLPKGGSYQVLPLGSRPYYCLIAVSFGRPGPSSVTPVGLDYCAASAGFRNILLGARDSGRDEYRPYTSALGTVLAVETPLYRGGTIPATVAGRRLAFLGAFGISVVPRVILDTALEDHPGMTVELRFSSASSPVAFRSAATIPRGQSTTVDLHDGWTMRSSGPALAAGMFADGNALGLLGGGIALSVLLSLLVFVLGTGRARARGMVRDKTQELSYQALHDTLTGLPSRALVLDRADRMLARAKRQPSIMPAALYVDIDRFKYVNDNFGHSAGDHLLKVVAERLVGVVRDQDTVGRLGGDEFIVLLESATRETPPDLVADRVIAVLREPVLLDDGETTLSASVSVGIAIGQRASADELIRDADLALYTAKAAGKDRAVLFQASMQTTAEVRRELEVDLDEAMADGQFFLLYQPILDLDSGGVVGVEALIRWRHPERGVIQPDDFIPLAEQTGRIVPIGRWVLAEACRQAAAWRARGHRMGVSVNVSGYQLDRDGFAQDVRQALRESGIEPSSLTLEITETALMRDVPAASERLKEIKTLGVRLAIDDFGTGSSSLAYLRQFAADSLKIDRSFIAGIADSRESAGIIHTLVELGRLLDIDTLAEGIEDPRQLEQLQQERCDFGQGFLFAKPLDGPGIERFLDASNGDGELPRSPALTPPVRLI
jgi:diguanylate cyclase (GGDEF)-like protein